MSNPTNKHGLTAAPASAQDLLTSSPNPAPTVPLTPIPETTLAQRINVDARTYLPDQTYNHSQRLLGLGTMRLSSSLVCCIWDHGGQYHRYRLHYEFFGGVLALRVLQSATHEDEDEANVGVHVREWGSPSGLRARDGPA
ncbi:hypothetical protein N7537_010980 [Penicillium hordei]|uniref:Uncharacterized protein n=1 Tax=Penicillium hordei TaxID=40994 RepID=A0AAD6GT70_9EURO|nr:uncharacterized protein N7537_010980 [Penicillium hordei]KAJ5588302.1 hypothetical protein N7537_010980 [Penicillium hordei]